MEQDEIKLAWQKLNEILNKSLLADKNRLEHILKSRRTTAHQKLIIADKTSTLFLFLLTIVTGYILLINNNGLMYIKIQAMAILLIVSVLNFICYQKLKKINFDDSVIKLFKQVSVYKRLTVWIYIITYIMVLIFLLSFVLSYNLSYNFKIFIYLMFPVFITIDYFLFHWTSKNIQTLINSSKELKELDEIE